MDPGTWMIEKDCLSVSKIFRSWHNVVAWGKPTEVMTYFQTVSVKQIFHSINVEEHFQIFQLRCPFLKDHSCWHCIRKQISKSRNIVLARTAWSSKTEVAPIIFCYHSSKLSARQEDNQGALEGSRQNIFWSLEGWSHLDTRGAFDRS